MLSSRELRLIERARLVPRRPLRGVVRGERLAKTRGTSTEFADTREYTPGDDLRHLDWNVLARLDHPVMRTYRDEEDLVVRIFVDVSPSMAFGDPPKRELASKLGAAFALAALAGGDGATLEPLGANAAPQRPFRGRVSSPRVLRRAEELNELEGNGALAASFRRLALGTGRATLVLALTDGLDPDLPTALRAAAGRGHEVWLVQILSSDEVEPDLDGDLELEDSETGALRPVTANRSVLSEYRDRLTAHTAALSTACVSGGGRFARMTCDESLEEFANRVLRREGWLA